MEELAAKPVGYGHVPEAPQYRVHNGREGCGLIDLDLEAPSVSNRWLQARCLRSRFLHLYGSCTR